MPLDLHIDDILTLKKPHACGANAWRIYRLGADIGLRCKECDRRVMIPRVDLERRIRLVQRGEEAYKPHLLPDER
jgi:hypothetical protein